MKPRGVRVPGGVWLAVGGEAVFVPDEGGASSSSQAKGIFNPVSPMPGKVAKVFVKAGDQVQAGASLVAVEAMKMEYLVRAPSEGKVGRLLCAEGQTVTLGQRLLDWEGA